MLDRNISADTAATATETAQDRQDLAGKIGRRAENLFLTHQFYCSESILLSLNKGLGGGLSESQAIGLAAPYSMAMGESGCACGALSGSVLAIGLFTGRLDAFGLRSEARRLAREMHDRFRKRHGSACCRILTRGVRNDPNAHRQHCATLTGWAAETAARLLIERFPELPLEIDADYLDRRESRLGGLLRRWGRRILS